MVWRRKTMSVDSLRGDAMKRLHKVSLALALVLGCGACASDSSTNETVKEAPTPTPSENTDPREGWVVVQPYKIGGDNGDYVSIFKVCDDLNLLYMSTGYGVYGGVTAIESSKECKS